MPHIAETAAAPSPSRRNASLLKRSISLAGHRTSVALEGAFWSVLEEVAKGRGQSLAALIASIDGERSAPGAPPVSLASALRVFALTSARTAHPEAGAHGGNGHAGG
ncbi:MAG: ribbon-helix-helix domain-containing protein [Alphaproteobacteria bacterium]|nr:ribbon-helix-helix domain-containing protein [Alphaproteobacteria bacterium]